MAVVPSFLLLVLLHALLLSSGLNRIEFLQSALAPIVLSSSTPRSTAPIATTSSLHQLRSSQSRHFRKIITQRVEQDPTLAGQLIRLAFHDAATLETSPRYLRVGNDVHDDATKRIPGSSLSQQQNHPLRTGGPNGSIQYELTDRYENRGLRRPLQVVQDARQEQQLVHPQSQPILSLADAIALAGAAAVQATGGPTIPIRLGRSDADTADGRFLRVVVPPHKTSTERSRVTTTLPSPTLDSDGLRTYFSTLHHLSEAEWVALCGSHGLGRHVSLLNMTKDCLRRDYTKLTTDSLNCLENAPVLLPFVTASVDRFDQTPLYFTSLLRWNDRQVSLGEVAFLPTDVALVVDAGLKRQVELFAREMEAPGYSPQQSMYYRAFSRGYQRLVDSTATTKELF